MKIDTEWTDQEQKSKTLKVRVPRFKKKYGAVLTGTNEFWSYVEPTFTQDLINSMAEWAFTQEPIPEHGPYHEFPLVPDWSYGMEAIPNAIKQWKTTTPAIRWHLFDNSHKLYKMQAIVDGKEFVLSLLLSDGFYISNTWINAWTEKFLHEVNNKEWDHHHPSSSVHGPILYWSDWWDTNWKRKING